MTKQNRALVARLAAMPVAGLGSLLVTRWMATGRSVTEFAFLTVVTGLPLLFTFGELGYGGVASSAVGAHRDEPHRAGRTIGAIATVYGLVALLIAVVVGLGALAGGTWDGGGGPGGWLGFPDLGLPAALALICAGLGVPASLGARVYIGLDRATFVIIVQAVPAVVTAVVIWLLLAVDSSVEWLAVGLLFGNLAVNVVLTVAALRRVRVRAVPFGSLRRVLGEAGYPAWPNFASSAAAIAIVQVPRLVLAHRGTDAAVAEFGVALVFLIPATSVAFVAGQALWSDFSHANARGELTFDHVRAAVRYGAVVGGVIGAGFALVGPFAAKLVAPDSPAHWGTYLSLAVLLFVFCIDLPLNVAMLTGPHVLRRGWVVIAQLVVAVVASVLLPSPTSSGLAWVQTLTVVLVVLVPSLYTLRRDLPPHARDQGNFQSPGAGRAEGHTEAETGSFLDHERGVT